MILYHGSNVPFESIGLLRSSLYKDFGRGFYLTSIEGQAEKMARRTARFYGGDPKATAFEWCSRDRLLQSSHVAFELARPYHKTHCSFSSLPVVLGKVLPRQQQPAA